jgi:hypothetical protein
MMYFAYGSNMDGARLHDLKSSQQVIKQTEGDV